MPSDTATAMQTTVVDQWAKGHNVGKYVEPQKLMPLSKGYVQKTYKKHCHCFYFVFTVTTLNQVHTALATGFITFALLIFVANSIKMSTARCFDCSCWYFANLLQ